MFHLKKKKLIKNATDSVSLGKLFPVVIKAHLFVFIAARFLRYMKNSLHIKIFLKKIVITSLLYLVAGYIHIPLKRIAVAAYVYWCCQKSFNRKQLAVTETK